MFSLVYNLIAQVEPSILESIQDSDRRLEDLNNQLDVVKNDYINVVGSYDTLTFFNINNIYFWFLILGLILLLFGLIYLLLELRQDNKSMEKPEAEELNTITNPLPEKEEELVDIFDTKPVTKVNEKVEEIIKPFDKPANISQEKAKPAKPVTKKKGPIKIKVVKVK